MKPKRWGRVALAVLLTPGWASAHNMIKGASDFYNGLLHPFFSLPHLLVTIALGALLGQQRERSGTAIALGFLASLAIGLGCAAFSVGFASETYLLAGAAITGFLLLLGRPVPAWLFAPLTLAMGVLMGLDFASEPAKSKAALGAGVGICLYFCFLYASLLSENFSKRKWQQTGLRVLGSWIAACAMLALSLRVFVK